MTSSGPSFDHIVRSLVDGDAAFLRPFVTRYGNAVAAALRRGGAPPADLDPLVHEVGISLIGRETDGDFDPWVVVLTAVDEVLARLAGDGDGGDDPPPLSGGGRRTLHLVDIENLAGGPRRVDRWFSTAVREFRLAAGVARDDHVVMAADQSLWKRTAFSFRDGRYLPAFGRDGADRRLLDAAPPEWVAERFDRLVIGSGDHAVAPMAAAAAARGVGVTVVARPRQLSRELRLAAGRVELLPDLETRATAAA
jgi:hypothetical protein